MIRQVAGHCEFHLGALPGGVDLHSLAPTCSVFSRVPFTLWWPSFSSGDEFRCDTDSVVSNLVVAAVRTGDAQVLILLGPETRRYSSAAAAWEIAIEWSLGKLPVPVPPEEFTRRLRIDSLVESPHIDEASALQVAKPPGLHNDPLTVLDSRSPSVTA
jgi:hypothetical protein